MQTYPYLDAAGGSSQNISATAATHPPASNLVNCTSDGTSCGTTGTYFRQIGYTSHMVTEPSSRNSLTRNDCNNPTEFFNTYFGVLAVPQWEAGFTLTVLTFFILLTIIGNTLVILSVFTYKPLRIVQNFFIVSLAVADLTVALLVMPLKVAYSIQGRWEFGIHVCKMWLTSDVMCCTSSILNLSTIALDRYWAITDPINYAQKRTVGRVLLLIAGVWVLSLVISSPPLVGWNDWPKQFTNATPCELTSNRGYVIYSALGSFFIPLILMTIVYIEIYAATKRRLRERAQASKMCALVTQLSDAEVPLPAGIGSCCSAYFCCGKDANRVQKTILQDRDSLSSETNVDAKSALPYYGAEQRVVVLTQKKTRQAKIKDSIKQVKQHGARASKRMCPPATHAVAHAAPERDLHTTKNSREEKAEIVLKANPPDSEPKDLPVEPKADSSNPDSPSKSEPPQEYTRAIDNKATQVQQKPSIMYTFIEEKQKISLSKERRAARTLGIIMGVFVICWLPFFLMYVILPFCDTCCPTNKLKNFVTWLGYFNSGLNPVIYTVFNIEYRRAFKRLLRLG